MNHLPESSRALNIISTNKIKQGNSCKLKYIQVKYNNSPDNIVITYIYIDPDIMTFTINYYSIVKYTKVYYYNRQHAA